ncbi:DUF3138 family protein [Undibacterium arcticum]
MHGKTSGTTSVNYLETDAYFTRGNLNLQGQLEAGLAKGSAFNGGDAKWIGLSTLASYKITSRLEGIARFDYIKKMTKKWRWYAKPGVPCWLPDR